MKVSLILTCAGRGERAKQNKNKLLVDVLGKNLIERSLSPFISSGLIDQYIITASKEDFEEISKKFSNIALIVEGGATRTNSVANALSKVSGDIVLIHDGARPFVTKRIIADCIESAKTFGSGITVYPSRDTIVRSDDEIKDYLGKSQLYLVQTPQAFDTAKIKNAYSQIGDKTFNDDGEIYLNFIGAPKTILGDANNLKITYPEDYELLYTSGDLRFGTGFDCHKLVENRKLILGGIEIPNDKGLLGHSDADVLTHAIMDAMLSSLALKDIGYHFSDKDVNYKDANSMHLLSNVLDMITEKGYAVKNISATIMAEKPKLLNYIPTITKSLADALKVDFSSFDIGATTLEGLGFVGREEGICVHATATLVKK